MKHSLLFLLNYIFLIAFQDIRSDSFHLPIFLRDPTSFRHSSFFSYKRTTSNSKLSSHQTLQEIKDVVENIHLDPNDNAKDGSKLLYYNVPLRKLQECDIFCNTELNMNSIQAIGFDMDYTLAQYKNEFDLLFYHGAIEKLITNFNYPSELRSFSFQPGLCRRGCLLDTQRGNVLKLDQHRYPRIVEHGLTPMPSAERKSIYRDSYQEYDAYNSPEFIFLDTAFQLVDAVLYIQLVDYKDSVSSTGNSVLKEKSYPQLWKDLRDCITQCHLDGTVKKIAEANPEKYIYHDPYCK
jgi:hypothetical protein